MLSGNVKFNRLMNKEEIRIFGCCYVVIGLSCVVKVMI